MPQFPIFGPWVFAAYARRVSTSKIAGPGSRKKAVCGAHRFAVQHGASPHPERMKMRLVFSLLNRKDLAAIFTAENYLPWAHNVNWWSERAKMAMRSQVSKQVKDAPGPYPVFTKYERPGTTLTF